MGFSINQAYLQFYQTRVNSLTTKHQIQSNRVLLFTNRVADTAEQINFYEQQKVLMLATPTGEQRAVRADYFELPVGFDPQDPDTWVDSNGDDKVYYTTPCQKQLYFYEEVDSGAYDATDPDYFKETVGGKERYYQKVEYDDSRVTDSRELSALLISGELTFGYSDDEGITHAIGYDGLPFVSQQEDTNAYQEMIEILEAERTNMHETEKKLQSEMQVTETEIQAINAMMESTEKVLQKNAESFKWG